MGISNAIRAEQKRLYLTHNFGGISRRIAGDTNRSHDVSILFPDHLFDTCQGRYGQQQEEKLPHNQSLLPFCPTLPGRCQGNV